MRYFVISDVHANLEAFVAVLERIGSLSQPGDKVVSLGDIVGYGPDPNQCIQLTKNEVHISLLGNHDYGVLGLTNIELFNPAAREAIAWTAQNLTKVSWNYLLSLKDKVLVEHSIATFVHSTPFEPTEWHYIVTYGIAKASFASMNTPLCFVGHSHQPVFIVESPNGALSIISPYEQPTLKYEPGSKYIINVGSVGQPRDGIADACFAVWDEAGGTIEIVRTPYDFRRTQQKIFARSLPGALATRLESGL